MIKIASKKSPSFILDVDTFVFRIFPLFIQVLHRWVVGAEEPVPVGEVGSVVAPEEDMVVLVVRGSSHEGQHPVQSPGQVVAAVVLHRQPGVDEVEDGFAERVAAHQPGAGHGQQQQGQQLGAAGVLRRQSERPPVLMVELVDVAVQPRSPGVKAHRHASLTPEEPPSQRAAAT